MKIKGKITKIGDVQTFQSGFQKRDIVVTTDEQYPQPLLIELLQDKVNLANNLQVGQHVSVSINLRGREWTNPQGEVKYFNSIVGWKIETNSTTQPSQDLGQPNDISKQEEDDDLPF